MSKEEYEDIIRFVLQEKHWKAVKALKKESEDVDIWHAGDDDDVEGQFLNWYTNEPMPYLPWEESRPFSASPTWNFIMSRIKFEIKNGTKEHAKIRDIPENMERIAICTVPAKSLRLKLRGLCSASLIFDFR